MIDLDKYARMDWVTYGNERERKGEEKGEKIGEKIGEKKGEERFAALIKKLLSLGREDDAWKASKDEAYRTDLYKEFQIL